MEDESRPANEERDELLARKEALRQFARKALMGDFVTYRKIGRAPEKHQAYTDGVIAGLALMMGHKEGDDLRELIKELTASLVDDKDLEEEVTKEIQADASAALETLLKRIEQQAAKRGGIRIIDLP
jgi:hypothetical protein